MNTISSRQQDIVMLARAQGRVSVEDLAARFEVSPQTIRKDLNDLCARRLMSRVHGGAMVTSGVENLAYEARRALAQGAKRAIAEAAAGIVPNRASLFINIGTTTEEVARALGGHEDLLVVTNNLNVAVELYRHPKIELIMAGGPVRRADGAVIGSVAVDFVRQFRVDYAVIGASAIEEDGTLLDFDYREVQVARAIIDNARQVILVADHSKLERSAPVRIGAMEEVDIFVTDQVASPALREVCARHSVELIEVGRREEEDF
ncbi:DeoR/GlpR family DNA-binding transcription regulator [Ancylobacter mangrovi]|uniref:DeoR/GlpR family DNA-binding transcription regulator n=1 Tax=Ancylobacter mangrovi TaxID=2972472 RepID=A0A9X2P979_9HYPH|nr:DeoR/GlpR family DNA-binding transcription regulator [Ancylobacter mangrovi]MCS0494366.1 DeoR/GlpR family DNA-binding transcription regulator [Ancylobacter mangrovi]MCS0500931.1 DeoR/GlpR family DNA-binding transcription regulator [Ancylobacter mangrovi]